MSTLKVNTIQNTSGVEVYTCKAWVNFDGTFGTSPFTIANNGIREAGNVSSVTDLSTGQYQVNFTTPMPHANYQVTGGVGTLPANTGWADLVILDASAAPSASSVRVGTIGYTSWQDSTIVTVSVIC